ncbi:type IV secretory system conjugative DNA transfer family protein [Mesorhizobium sp. M0019]|uniref:type IV secretory system conjugative DNA transfer family protein n=1 Tax=Mesorhizobium sp. M0019 TaxID=2956845 RepID=UPI00333D1964
MPDWFKDFDPLKGMEPFGSSRKGATEGLSTGIKIGSAITNMFAQRRARKQIENEQREEQRRVDEGIANPPPLHGSARWAEASDLLKADLLHPTAKFESPSSILIGAFEDPALGGAVAGQIHWDGEGHLLTVAPTRSGKSTTTIIPNLVRYKGSCVVLDPKGELYAQTAAWRRQNVGPVYRIAPFQPETDAYNPLDGVVSFSDAQALADLIMPPDPNAPDFFRKDAIAILTAIIMFVTESAPPGHRSMAEVRRITAAPLDLFTEAIRTMAGSRNHAIANAANIVLGKDRSKSIPNLRDTINTEFALWDDPGLHRATSVASFDFRSLKDAPATVYITVPFHKMSAYAAFLKITLTTALDAMLQNETIPDIPVLFILDEFLSLGPFPRFRDAIRTHAGAGVRLWFFLQDVPTLEEHYPAGWKTFFNTSVKTFFGTDEHFTAAMISDFLGDQTRGYRTAGTSNSASTGPVFSGNGAGTGSVNHGIAYSGRPLLTPDEVTELLSGSAADQTRIGLVFARGVRPIRAKLVPWYLGQDCRERVIPPANRRT